ncbi:MAG: extracellular solute-binding protein [Ruminococcaceae bacterium]|nr:extracellular solute-binding protein [Oscillospiraceae bacterium]
MNRSRKIIAVIMLLVLIFSVNAEVLYASHTHDKNNSDITANMEVYQDYKTDDKFEKATEIIELDAKNSLSGGILTEDGTALKVTKGNAIEFSVNVPESAAYNIALSFAPLDEITENYKISLKIDGESPFSECNELILMALWEDDGEIRTLTNGDQVSPLQKHKEGFYLQKLMDDEGIERYPYEFMLSKGKHNIKIEAIGKDLLIEKVCFLPPEIVKSYSEVSKNYSNYEKYTGPQIVIEAENAAYKNAYSLSSKSDQSTADISPSSATNAIINYIGGTTWNTPGAEITWRVKVPKDGLYKLGIAFKQSYVTDGEVYRWLKIDGKTPFLEAQNINFPYSTKWQFKEFANDNKGDYLIYLTEGEHELSLAVTLSDVAEVFGRLQKIVGPLGDLYLDIVMITGETPDANRDYELHKQIPDFEKTLDDAYKQINALTADIGTNLKVNGELNGALKNMARIIKEMKDNLYDAHLQVQTFYSAQQTLSAWLYDIKNMSLSVDQIILAAPDKEFDTPKADFFGRIKFFLMRYINSYLNNSSSLSSSDDETLPSIKIWVNWGRDQVKVLNSLIQDSFTPQNDVNVTVEQVNATLVQGVISGNSPDLYLHMARTEPVNLAMRGVLYDLRNFEDYEKVLKENFLDGAETPYIYKNGTYALPDTQNFFVMFYRKDILEKMKLDVPVTWEDFLTVTGILQRNKMNTYLPYTKLGAANTVNIGAGGLTIFPTMLMQRGAHVYNKELNATNLASAESIEAFKFWTEFYTEYSLEQDANFYQKFRIGTMPLGIASYTQYLTIKLGAPEIQGKWGIAPIPGILKEDGTVDNTCSGSGTGVSIMKSSKNKDAAWKFIKWWVSADTQYRYSAEVEAIIGETGRTSSANPEAVSRLNWEDEALEVILSQWKKVKEIPEVPGSYYVSRSIDQAFWATKNGKKSAKEAIIDWSETSDKEIMRKIKEYANKNYGG